MSYEANAKRYESMIYRRSGKSGLQLPAISFGLWHNFGDVNPLDNQRQLILKAFDLGVTHFDLANNYGPPAGSAEENFGRILKTDLQAYRDELIISSKAGYTMWTGPYGDWGSKKSMMASLDQSLKRMGLDYVDIFYSHRPDPHTPMEETMGALDLMVRQGKVLYVGLSRYSVEETKKAVGILKALGTPCLIHQENYSMFNRGIENGLLDVLEEEGIGSIVFRPLDQGILTDRYLKGIPADSRAASGSKFLNADQVLSEKIEKVMALNILAKERGQSIAQMALAWALRKGRVTSVIIGASKVEQLEDNIDAIRNLEFAENELKSIEKVLQG
jgi:L-glyceraldehyde 3-phosphate reductase